MEKYKQLIKKVKQNTDLPIGVGFGIKTSSQVKEISDFSDATWADKTANVCDLIQIPAYLCRQTSILKAANLIKTGKVYGLGIIIDANTPAYPPRSLSLQVVQPNQQFGNQQSPNSTYNDDIFQLRYLNELIYMSFINIWYISLLPLSCIIRGNQMKD